MQAGITTEYTVVAIGVDLHVELLAKLYEVFGIFHAISERIHKRQERKSL